MCFIIITEGNAIIRDYGLYIETLQAIIFILLLGMIFRVLNIFFIFHQVQ